MISVVATALLPVAAEEEHPSVLAVPLDIFILGLAAFFIVFFVLWKLVLPNITKTLAERTDSIEGGMQRAADAEEQANALKAQYREQIADAHQEAADIRAKAEADGKTIVAEARAQAEAERASIAQRGAAQLAAERTQTVASLRSDVGGIAIDLAGRIVGESLTDDQRARTVVDRFIAELEQAAPSTGSGSGGVGSGSESA